MIILDTNVISELMNRKPDAAVLSWSDSQRRSQLVTTAITVMELHAGVERLKLGRRKSELKDLVDWALDELLEGRVLNFDRKAAVETAGFFGRCRAMGRAVETRDSQIAGIAIARRIPVATRNVTHFEDAGIKVIDPWAAD